MQQGASSTVRMLSYRELLLTLQKLCKEKRTGSMFINDGLGHTAKLILEDGVIFDIIFKEQSGEAAIALLKEIKQGTASFSTRFGQAQTEKKIKLSTLEIFQILASTAQAATSPQTVATTTTGAQIPQESGIPSKNTLQIEVPADYQAPEILQKADFSTVTGMVALEELLAVIIGPVARIIYLSYIKDVVMAADIKELNSVLEKIAQQVLTLEQQQLFRQSVSTFTKQYNLKSQEAILDSLRGSQKKLRLNPATLALFVSKHAERGGLGANLLSKLAVLFEQGGNIGKLATLFDVLVLLEKSGKTGLLEVREKEKVGGFYFDKGVLINAVQCGINGKLVAMEMLQWQADYLVFRAVPQEGVSHQIHQTVDVLAKEVERLHGSAIIPRISRPTLSKADEILLFSKAVHLAESCDSARAELLLCQILNSYEDSFKGWFWLSRVLTNMTGIEIALKKAAFINIKHPDIAEEVKKFTLARKAINGDFVLRCPFCWTPVDEQEVECLYCKAHFFITPDFFKLVGKARTDLLDKAIERFSNALQDQQTARQNVYLRFYLAIAYLNRKYYQEGLDQFDEIVKLAPENHALLAQNRILRDWMGSAGLVVVSDSHKVAEEKTDVLSTTKHKILIVEDSMVTRKVIARALVAGGYEVFEAKNAFEALTDFEKRNPDLVLLDIVLPGKDGYEILAEIRQKPQFAKLPVIMLTSRDSLFDKLKGKVSDANEYLTKPFQPEQLLTVVHKYLGKKL